MMRRAISAAIPIFLAMTALTHAQGGGGQFAATLGQAFAGPVGDDEVTTMVTVTNRDLQDCTAGFFFSLGTTTTTPAVFLNGTNTQSLDLTIPSGGARMVTMTADELIQGLMDVFVVSPCTPSSLSVSGNYTILGPDGQVKEVFTLRPNTANEWLSDGRCMVVTTNQNPTGEGGSVENLGVATSSVFPGFPAPTGTNLELFLFNQEGQRIGASTLPVTGEHTASFPIPSDISGKVIVIFCLRSGDASYELDLTPVKLVQRQDTFQFDNAIFADGFESGDVSAWSNQLP